MTDDTLPRPVPAPDRGAHPLGAPRRPRVAVVGTGGTIAGSAAASETTSYRAAVFGVADLLAAVPAAGELAELSYHEVFRIDSVDMTFERQLQVARTVAGLLAGDDVDAALITHGTDTLEETAYLLHLLVRSPKPVVVVGAMRPADAPGADGPANLLAGLRTAISPHSRGLGTLVVMSDEVHSGRVVVKRHTSSVQAFGSVPGPLGEVLPEGPRYEARPLRRYGATSAFDLDGIAELPPVEIVVGRAGLPPEMIRAVADGGARGLVYVGAGEGNVAQDVADQLDEARARGLVVVRTSRVGAGIVARNGAVDDEAHGWVAGGDLNPYKARALLALALTRTTDPREVQELFDTH